MPSFYKDTVELWIKPGVPSCHMGVGVWFREGDRCQCSSLNTVATSVSTGCWGRFQDRQTCAFEFLLQRSLFSSSAVRSLPVGWGILIAVADQEVGVVEF
jgi:hypothetical protein